MDKAADGPVEDVAMVVGASVDSQQLAVLRKRGGELSAAILRAAKEGQPLHGELIRLRARDGEPHLYDVESVYEAPRDRSADRGRPAQVATEEYRDGWDRLWKGRKPASLPS